MNNNELNKEGLEASAKEADRFLKVEGWCALTTDRWEKILKAAIRAYLPYHNADVVEENKKLWEYYHANKECEELDRKFMESFEDYHLREKNSELRLAKAKQALNLDAQNQPKMNDKEV